MIRPCAARLDRRLRGGRGAGARGRVGRRRGAAAAARRDEGARRGPRLADSPAVEHDRAPANGPARVRTGRPFPSIAGPAPPSTPPDTRALSSAAVRQARPSVVRITATACGLGVEGSGWVARPQFVVTAAHVVEGASDIEADGHPARALVVDRKQDVAVLRVRGCALLAADRRRALGRFGGDSRLPGERPLRRQARADRATADVLTSGSLREVTAIRGLIRHGNSGGPAVNEAGRVEATVFAARIGGRPGYGVPAAPVPWRSCAPRTRCPPAAARAWPGDRGRRAACGTARHDVDAGRQLACLPHQFPDERGAHFRGVGPRGPVALLDVLRHDDPRCFVVDPDGELERADRPHADEQRHRRAADPFEKRLQARRCRRGPASSPTALPRRSCGRSARLPARGRRRSGSRLPRGRTRSAHRSGGRGNRCRR